MFKLILAAIFLSGCTLVGVPSANDSTTKRHQAEELVKTGRSTGAMLLYEDAIKIDINSNNYRGLAETHYSLSQAQKYWKRYNEAEQSLKQSEIYAQKANIGILEARAIFEQGVIKHLNNNQDAACELARKSLEKYKASAVSQPDIKLNMSNTKNYGVYINNFMGKLGCN